MKKKIKCLLEIIFSVLILAGCSIHSENDKTQQREDFTTESETMSEEQKTNYEMNKAAVSFVIDDGYRDVLNNKKIFDKYGMKGCLAIITGYLGEDLYLTKEEVIDIYNDGWEIVSHTDTHPGNWDTIKEAVIEEEYDKSLTTLRRMGISVKGIAIPNVYIPERLVPITKDYFTYCLGDTDEETDYVYHRVHMTVLDGSGEENTDKAVKDIKQKIDQIIDNKEYCIFFFHYANAFEPWLTKPDINDEMLEEVLSYLNTKKDTIEVITPREYFLENEQK